MNVTRQRSMPPRYLVDVATLSELLDVVRRNLKPKVAEVIECVYCCGMTRSATAKEVRLPRHRVCYFESMGLRKLRHPTIVSAAVGELGHSMLGVKILDKPHDSNNSHNCTLQK